MARKLRLEYPGPIYHVINRGNYRTGVFATAGAKAAFEKCLFEASAKSGWVLHAFVVMRNHYHLALETPTGNLVTGMQWLQATFANRFNRLRGERGHLFQGRYKALLVEEGGSAGAGVPLPAFESGAGGRGVDGAAGRPKGPDGAQGNRRRGDRQQGALQELPRRSR